MLAVAVVWPVSGTDAGAGGCCGAGTGDAQRHQDTAGVSPRRQPATSSPVARHPQTHDRQRRTRHVSNFSMHVALRVHCCRQTAHCASWEAKYRQQNIMYSSLQPNQSNQPKTKNFRPDLIRPVWTQPMCMSADISMGWVHTWVG